METYRVEILVSEAEGGIFRRVLIRASSIETIKERALTLFSRARRPQSYGAAVEAVRVLDGAGYEVFRASVRD